MATVTDAEILKYVKTWKQHLVEIYRIGEYTIAQAHGFRPDGSAEHDEFYSWHGEKCTRHGDSSLDGAILRAMELCHLGHNSQFTDFALKMLEAK